jgi:hypothetical protein
MTSDARSDGRTSDRAGGRGANGAYAARPETVKDEGGVAPIVKAGDPELLIDPEAARQEREGLQGQSEGEDET